MREFIESRAGVTLVLFFGLIFFSMALIACSVALPSNERIYAYLSGIGGGFAGALFTFLQVRSHEKDEELRASRGARIAESDSRP